MSSSLAIPPSGHCAGLPSVSCPPIFEGVLLSLDTPLPTCWFSSLTSLQVFLWGEALVLPWLCLLGQMAHCGGYPAPSSRSATLCRLVLSVAQMGSEETSPALENSCSHVTNYAGDSNNLSPPQLRETFKARRGGKGTEV